MDNLRGETFVVTSSTGDGQNRERYSKDTNTRREYRGNDDKGRERSNSEYRPNRSYNNSGEGRPSRPYNNNGEGRPSRPYNNSGEGRPSRPYNNNGESRPSRPYNNNGEGRPSRPYGNDGNKSYKGSYNNNYGMMAKDKDMDEQPRRSKPRVATDKEGKVKEQQPDKIDIINRLEKEKKAMQKKETLKKKDSKASKVLPKVKRSNNIDWTKEYENDSFDDDDMDFYKF